VCIYIYIYIYIYSKQQKVAIINRFYADIYFHAKNVAIVVSPASIMLHLASLRLLIKPVKHSRSVYYYSF
jgi:hypothetical protein